MRLKRVAAAWAAIAIFALGASPARAEGGSVPARADVVGVETRGRAGAYRFFVTLRSPDQGCNHYANWWEVVRADGTLAYRRILRHSHPNEQPFTRAGGPVAVERDEVVVVRGHMRATGYGGAVFRGSVTEGFSRWVEVPEKHAPGLEDLPPQPAGCLY